jgi:hypothetical protein
MADLGKAYAACRESATVRTAARRRQSVAAAVPECRSAQMDH